MANIKHDHEKMCKEVIKLCDEFTLPAKPNILKHISKRVKRLNQSKPENLKKIATEKVLKTLRQFLIQKEKEIRTLAIQVIRYLCVSPEDFKKLHSLKVEHFIVRAFDMEGKSQERLEAFKLIRKWIEQSPSNFPKSFCNALVALSEVENDEFKDFGLEALRYLSSKNLPLVSWSGGVRVLILSTLDLKSSQYLSENIVITLSYILNDPTSRVFLKNGAEISRVLSIFTDYESGLKENELEAALKLTRKFLVSMVRSWPGLIYLLSNGFSDVIASLKYPLKTIIKEGILETVYDMVNLPVDSSVKYYNILNNYLAMLIKGLINCGLYSSLSHCAVDRNPRIAQRARKLLKIVTKTASDLLPGSPQVSLNLIGNEGKTAELVADIASSARIQGIVNDKSLINEVCDFITIDLGGSSQVLSGIYKQHFLNSLDDSQYIGLINRSQVSKEVSKWDWDIIYEIISGPISIPIRFSHPQSQKFLKTIVGFFMPSKGLFSVLPWHFSHFVKSKVGSKLISLLLSQEEGIALLSTTYSESFFVVRKSYMGELSDALDEEIKFEECKVESNSRILSADRMKKYMAREYFRWLGIFLANRSGKKLIKTYNFDGKIMKLANIEHLAPVLLSVMDFKDQTSQQFLVLMLQSKSRVLRMKAMEWLRGLYRAGTYDLVWSVWVLKNQLYSSDEDSVLMALSLLDEICQYKDNLLSLIETGPHVLLKLGEPGNKVLIRFLSSSKGVKYLSDIEYIQNELLKWHESLNTDYTQQIEEKIEIGLANPKKFYVLTLTTPKIYQHSDRFQINWISKIPFTVVLQSPLKKIELDAVVEIDREEVYLSAYLDDQSFHLNENISASLMLASNYIDSKGSELAEGIFVKCQKKANNAYLTSNDMQAVDNNGVSFIFNKQGKLHKVLMKLQVLPKGPPSLQIPRHVFGELGKTSAGLEILTKAKYLEDYSLKIMLEYSPIQKRAWLWALGHTGASNHGASYLTKIGCIQNIVKTAEKSMILSLRGTAAQALSLIARSSVGRSELSKYSWYSHYPYMSSIAVPDNAESFFWVEKNDSLFPFNEQCLKIEEIFENIDLVDSEKEVLKHICFLGSVMSKSASEQFLKTLRTNAPGTFCSLPLFHSVMTVLAGYNFKLSTRRMIHKLFERIYKVENLDDLDQYKYI